MEGGRVLASLGERWGDGMSWEVGVRVSGGGQDEASVGREVGCGEWSAMVKTGSSQWRK